MTFCQEVKEEIIKNEKPKDCCAVAYLSAFFSSIGEISFDDDITIKMTVRNQKFMNFVKMLLDKASSPKYLVQKKGGAFDISIPNAREFVIYLKVALENQNFFELVDGINRDFFRKECCMRSYLLGLFLASGSLRIPYISQVNSQVKGGYHMEIVTGSLNMALDAQEMFSYFGFDAKTRSKEGSQLLYFKSSEEIGDILTFFNASNSMLSLQNSKILRSLRANANRQSNCVTANINRSIIASQKQILAITFLQNNSMLLKLPDDYQVIASARMENPEASLDELVNILGNAFSKSAVYYKLKKLVSIYEKHSKS